MLKGFPPSNHLNGLDSTDSDGQTIALVGFAAKGPANTPTVIRSSQQLRTTFGTPHPDQKEAHLLYAAEQCLLAGVNLVIYRAVSEDAQTASTLIPGVDNLVNIQSSKPSPYVFTCTQFFRWKLNGVLSGKTLVVLATDDKGISAVELADELNDQLQPKDGIKFYAREDKYLAVRTTASSKNELELVSVQNAMYGPWGVTGLGGQMTPAEKVGVEKEIHDFTAYEDLMLEIIINGSKNVTVDNVVQSISLKGLEDKKNTVLDVVDYINNVVLPGGWRAFASGNALGVRTNHAGQDATILVRPTLAAKMFGLDSTLARGKSPKDEAIFFGSKARTGNISMTIHADSPGTEGNNTRVLITNDEETGTFTIDVFNNGIQVESWGQLSKNKSDQFYVESFVNLFSNWIRVVDHQNTPDLPKNGTYKLGDTRVAGAGKGTDGTQKESLIVQGIEEVQADIIAAPGLTADKVIRALIDKDAMAVIDPPMEFSLRETALWLGICESSTTTVFWPWVSVRDAHNRRNVWVPPSGSVIAALIGNSHKNILPGVLDVFAYAKHEERMNDINIITAYGNTGSFAVDGRKLLSGNNYTSQYLSKT